MLEIDALHIETAAVERQRHRPRDAGRERNLGCQFLSGLVDGENALRVRAHVDGTRATSEPRRLAVHGRDAEREQCGEDQRSHRSPHVGSNLNIVIPRKKLEGGDRRFALAAVVSDRQWTEIVLSESLLPDRDAREALIDDFF